MSIRKKINLSGIKKNKTKNLVTFVSVIPGLEEIEECKPAPANAFIPEWWKQTPSLLENYSAGTVKSCPSFPSYFSSGYVLRMWADTVINYNPKTDEWRWSCGRPAVDNPFRVEIHGNEQFVNYAKPSFLGVQGQIIFKLECPWRLITPPGYSSLQLPMFYDFDGRFTTIPGIVETDRYHQLSPQIIYHGEGEDIFIERGTPLAQYIPIKREKMKFSTRYKTEEDDKRFLQHELSLITLLPNRRAYKKIKNN